MLEMLLFLSPQAESFKPLDCSNSMRILLTGATGYIGKRLLPLLLEAGHEVICCVRDESRFPTERIYAHPNIKLFEVDFLKLPPKNELPRSIDAAYYLIHSMSEGIKDFEKLEAEAAQNFLRLLEQTSATQIIYLSGITNEHALSRHLASRKNVEDNLKRGTIAVTILKAGIIVGSGSASFEIIRDLVEKLPVMIAPRWLKTKHQPIAIRDVLECLMGVLLNRDTYNKSFDIGGPDILSYKEMLLAFAEVRGLKRLILTVPVMTPRLSSYWLYFVTATSYKLAVNLVDSMKVEIIARDDALVSMLGIHRTSYKDAIRQAFQQVEQNTVISSWKDSLVSSSGENSLRSHMEVPVHGCFTDKRERVFDREDLERVVQNIWSIGGDRGWYYANWLWQLRGVLDKTVGGVGLRRGRTNARSINAGDSIDFWRVLIADRSRKRLLLYAEMKLPGEAWLEFIVLERGNSRILRQTATFRPRGLFGRIYWYSVLPLHYFVFNGLATNLVRHVPR